MQNIEKNVLYEGKLLKQTNKKKLFSFIRASPD